MIGKRMLFGTTVVALSVLLGCGGGVEQQNAISGTEMVTASSAGSRTLIFAEEFDTMDLWREAPKTGGQVRLSDGKLWLVNGRHGPLAYRTDWDVIGDIDIEVRLVCYNGLFHLSLPVADAINPTAELVNPGGTTSPVNGPDFQLSFRQGVPEPSWLLRLYENGSAPFQWFGHNVADGQWHDLTIKIRTDHISFLLDGSDMGTVGVAMPMGLERRMWLGTTYGDTLVDYVRVYDASDNEPPVISDLAVTPDILWPPNRKKIDVNVSGLLQDNTAVTEASIEVADEYGELAFSATTLPLSEDGEFSFSVPLVSARAGGDMDGRVYTMTIAATDAAGNTVTQSATAIVPHDRRRG